jgi:hypothetical protein
VALRFRLRFISAFVRLRRDQPADKAAFASDLVRRTAIREVSAVA